MTFGISGDEATVKVIDRYPILNELCQRMHGNGINYDWHLEENDREVRLSNRYDCMNDGGMEVGSQAFTIIMPKRDILDFKIQCNDQYRYWWDKNMVGDYLEEATAMWLDTLFKSMSQGPPILTGFWAKTVYSLHPSTPEKREEIRKQRGKR